MIYWFSVSLIRNHFSFFLIATNLVRFRPQVKEIDSSCHLEEHRPTDYFITWWKKLKFMLGWNWFTPKHHLPHFTGHRGTCSRPNNFNFLKVNITVKMLILPIWGLMYCLLWPQPSLFLQWRQSWWVLWRWSTACWGWWCKTSVHSSWPRDASCQDPASRPPSHGSLHAPSGDERSDEQSWETFVRFLYLLYMFVIIQHCSNVNISNDKE